MRRFDPDRIRSIHLELTTGCNASCPMCARTGRGVPRDGLATVDLSIADIRTILPVSTLATVESVDLCGAFGDPLVARDIDEILIHLRQDRARTVDIYTNGSLRSSRWWAALPALLGPEGKVCFGIDGLADTNAIYRVGTSFPTIMRNAASFIGHGGHAQWDFLVFRHNQHQVEAARRMAKDMGFADFSVKVSSRFYRRFHEEMPELADDEGYARFPVFGRDGRRRAYLEPPDEAAYRNPAHALMRALVAKEGSLDPTFDRDPIRCLSIARESIFVSAEGTVFPCCWTYIASKYGSLFKMVEPVNLRIADLLDAAGGPDAINAKRHALREIVAGPFFAALQRSWSAASLAAGKPKTCARTCGRSFSPMDAYEVPRLSPYARRPPTPSSMSARPS